MERSRKTTGISLVALVVTIIVLIILTGAVIATFMEGGIIDKAKESVFKNDIRSYQEILIVKNGVNEIDLQTGNGTVERLNATDLADIQGILPEFKDEYKELVAISEGELVLGTRVTQPEKDMTDDEKQYRDWLLELGIGIASEGGDEVSKEEEVIEELDPSVYTITDGVLSINEGATITQTKFRIPDGVTSLGENGLFTSQEDFVTPVDGATNIEKVIIPSSVTSIGWGAFQGCSNLSEVIFEGNITSISSNAFFGTAISSLTFPDGLKSIGSWVFSDYYGLEGAILPGTVTNIGTAFLCNLTYGGTKAQFKTALYNDGDTITWYTDTSASEDLANFTITCTDGTMTFAEAVQ